jgi:hypothetical protein
MPVDAGSRWRELQAEIARVGRETEEVWTVRLSELPPGWSAGPERSRSAIVAMWLSGVSGDEHQKFPDF